LLLTPLDHQGLAWGVWNTVEKALVLFTG